MRKVILIGGVFAAGKSTYANILQQKFALTTVTKDHLKEILGDNIKVDNREENKKLSVICFELMRYLLECNQGTIVLECNFKSYELAELKQLCERLGYETLSLVFDADNQVLHQRFLARLQQNRHYVHKSQDFTNIDDFIPELDKLRNVSYFGEVIRVNCNSFDYQTDASLFAQIADFLQK